MSRIKLVLFLALLPLSAFGAITGNDRGVGANSNNEASTAMSPSSTIAAGSTGILVMALDNTNNTAINVPTSITDSVGNVWVLRRETPGSGGSANNLERALYSCDPLVTQLTSSNNVTITYTAINVTAKCWAFVEAVPGTAGNIVLFKSSASANIATNTGTSVSNGATLGDIAVGFAGGESADTWVADSDTLNGSWSTMQHTGTGAGATGMSLISQWKVTNTASGSQTYNPTLTSADNGAYLASWGEAPAVARANIGNANSEATTTLTFAKPLAANSLGVIVWAGKNSGTNGNTANLPSTLTDSRSNTWTLRQEGLFDNGVAAAGTEFGFYTAPITTAIVANDTVDLTYTVTSCATKMMFALEFSDATGFAAAAAGSGSTTGTPSITTSSIAFPDYVIGVVSVEGDNTYTADSDTTNGSWSYPFINTANAGGNSALIQYKKVTSSGAQTFNPTYTSGDTSLGWMELTVSASLKIPSVPSVPSIGQP